MLETFDAPNGDMSCVRRVRSNTPLQALTTLNEPIFLEAARALAAHTLADGGKTDTSVLTTHFAAALPVNPIRRRRVNLMAFLEKETHRYQDGELNPWDLLGGNDALAPLLPKSLTPRRWRGGLRFPVSAQSG